LKVLIHDKVCFDRNGWNLIVYYLHEIHTGIGQNNGNTTDAVHISLLIWCWTTVCLQFSHNPRNGLIQVLNTLWQNFIPFFVKEHLQGALEMLEVGICSSH
jgi:hypothetical protein